MHLDLFYSFYVYAESNRYLHKVFYKFYIFLFDAKVLHDNGWLIFKFHPYGLKQGSVFNVSGHSRVHGLFVLSRLNVSTLPNLKPLGSSIQPVDSHGVYSHGGQFRAWQYTSFEVVHDPVPTAGV